MSEPKAALSLAQEGEVTPSRPSEPQDEGGRPWGGREFQVRDQRFKAFVVPHAVVTGAFAGSAPPQGCSVLLVTVSCWRGQMLGRLLDGDLGSWSLETQGWVSSSPSVVTSRGDKERPQEGSMG